MVLSEIDQLYSLVVLSDSLGGCPFLELLFAQVHLKSYYGAAELNCDLIPMNFHILLQLHERSELGSVVIDEELAAHVADVGVLATHRDVANTNLALVSSSLRYQLRLPA